MDRGSISGGYSSEVNQFNDAANTWTTKANLSAVRGDATSIVLNNLGYVVSGYTGSVVTNLTEQYNDTQNVWITKANAGTARQGSYGFDLNGYGYNCNGTTGSQSSEVNQYVSNDKLVVVNVTLKVEE